jgi:hypothetical protein
MQFIKALKDVCFLNPVYGEGTLKHGKTYYTFGQFAREAQQQGLAQILAQAPGRVNAFLPGHLGAAGGPRKILLMFSGGWGDAITVGIILPAVMEQYHLDFDICCAKNKWDAVFQPMAVPGQHIPFPPDLETLNAYEAILSDITGFFYASGDLKISPVIQLQRGFRIQLRPDTAGYRIPRETKYKLQLPLSTHKKIGLNLDSNGLIKSYPLKLHQALLKTLRSLNLDIHLLGNRGSSLDLCNGDGLFDWRAKTTVPELAALLEQMDLIIGVDSFIVHLADLLHKPSLVLLATTAASYFAWHTHIVCLKSDLNCSPCFAVFNQCPHGYPGCQAFEHPSISPEKIGLRIKDFLLSQMIH